jgi:hypothetical protein
MSKEEIYQDRKYFVVLPNDPVLINVTIVPASHELTHAQTKLPLSL